MSLVNYSTREITSKIVYYGPGRSGKTTNLQYVHSQVPEDRRGRMVSLATETDRTLFFDFLPLELGTISGFQTRFQLYTVPGQVYYDATRKLVLQGADGVVFVADSQRAQMQENVESFRNLQVNLLEQGVDPRTIPIVLQYNKRDLPDVMSVEEMDDLLNYRDLPRFEAQALGGVGVFDTLKGISELVLRRLSQRFGRTVTPAGAGSGA
ncbi:MAG TPA: GTPase domain-containing protein [Longimicrobium sp.]|nr:GTPase domain-containing protein [Longimicrobium sp.]